MLGARRAFAGRSLDLGPLVGQRRLVTLAHALAQTLGATRAKVVRALGASTQAPDGLLEVVCQREGAGHRRLAPEQPERHAQLRVALGDRKLDLAETEAALSHRAHQLGHPRSTTSRDAALLLDCAALSLAAARL